MSGPSTSLITLLRAQSAPRCLWNAVGVLCSEALAPTGPLRAPPLRCSQGSSPEFLDIFLPSHSQASLAAFSIIPITPFPSFFFSFSFLLYFFFSALSTDKYFFFKISFHSIYFICLLSASPLEQGFPHLWDPVPNDLRWS